MLREFGVDISIVDGNGVSKDGKSANKTIVVSNDKSRPDYRFKAFNVETKVFPGFPTDLQSPMVVFLTQSEGESSVLETIFEGRFKYVDDLVKMGADITKIDQDKILVKGPTPLREISADDILSAHDIRAGFAIVLACLLAKGKFVINNVHLIDRGYESLELRLRDLGADVVRE